MKNYQNIYDVISASAYRIAYDDSAAFKYNPTYIDRQIPLWLVLECGNDRLWISHSDGKYKLSRRGGINFCFKTQREFLPFLEKTLQNRESA